MNTSPHKSSKRDSVTLRILGVFFTLLGGLVLIATLWTLEDPRATVVNIGSGLMLILVGVVMIATAGRLDSSAINAANATGVCQ